MVHKESPFYSYTKENITSFVPEVIGVYYLMGTKSSEGKYPVYYVGKSGYRSLQDNSIVGGLQIRLLEHISNNEWPDIAIFSYVQCDYLSEVDELEVAEIEKYKPKHNEVGKTL